jgi:hypothetical protein
MNEEKRTEMENYDLDPTAVIMVVREGGPEVALVTVEADVFRHAMSEAEERIEGEYDGMWYAEDRLDDYLVRAESRDISILR